MKHRLVIVTPVYEDRKSARCLLTNLAQNCSKPLYIVAVEDGSLRDPLTVADLEETGHSGVVLHLVRNMGHQRAIAVGISYVAANLNTEAIVVMDSDGEDRPDAVEPLVAALKSGNFDAVVAERRKRSESLSFVLFYTVYKFLFQLATGRPIRFGNFTALSMPAVKRLAAMQELWVHVAASVVVSRLRVGSVPTDRGKRYAGQSQMSFVSLVLHGLRSMMVFAEDALVRVGLTCMLIAVGATGLLITSFVLKGFGIATPGWFSIAVGILLVILMQAGVLTFSILMVSGLIKSAPPITTAELARLIERVERTKDSVFQQDRSDD